MKHNLLPLVVSQCYVSHFPYFNFDTCAGNLTKPHKSECDLLPEFKFVRDLSLTLSNTTPSHPRCHSDMWTIPDGNPYFYVTPWCGESEKPRESECDKLPESRFTRDLTLMLSNTIPSLQWCHNAMSAISDGAPYFNFATCGGESGKAIHIKHNPHPPSASQCHVS